jgi:hypothetical protein
MTTQTKAPKREQPVELKLEDVAVFALPEREALTTCCGSLLSIDVDVRVGINLGGGGCHSGCW